MGLTDKAKDAVHRTRDHVQEKSRWVEAAGRTGLISVGLSYGIVGLIALTVAVRGGGQTHDRHGALSSLSNEPLGKALLVALALGFAGYALWRLILALTGEGVEEKDEKGHLKRIGYLLRGLFYVGMSVGTAALVFTGPNGDSQGSEPREVAVVLNLPGGRLLVAGTGLVVACVGVFNLWRAVSGSFKDSLKTRKMKAEEERMLSGISRFGLTARGFAFLLVALFLVRAAVQYDPREAVGLDGALARLASTSLGPWLLAAAGLGLLAYAAFRLVEARYREI